MTDETRIRGLLEQILESGRTPEEVCAECPELLPVVRTRLRQIRRLEQGLKTLFPPGEPNAAPKPRQPERDQMAHSNGNPAPARHISWLRHSTMWLRRYPSAAAITIVFVILVIMGAILGATIWWLWDQPRRDAGARAASVADQWTMAKIARYNPGRARPSTDSHSGAGLR